MNILVVDDEPFFIEELIRIVDHFRESTGHPVFVSCTAYSAEEALLLLQSGNPAPDVVFTDIRMASMDGLDLAKTIYEEWPNLPVAIISGYPSFEYARDAMRVQVLDYILKPIDRPNVFGLLERLYEDHRVRGYEKMQQWLQRLLLLDSQPLIDDWIASAPNGKGLFQLYAVRSPEPSFYTEEWFIRHAGIGSKGKLSSFVCTLSKREFVVFVDVASSGEKEPEGEPAGSMDIRQLMSQNLFPVNVARSESPVHIDRILSVLPLLLRKLDEAVVIEQSAGEVVPNSPSALGKGSFNVESAALYNNIAGYISTHYRESITTQDIGDRFHVSRTTLYNLFREYGETTFIEYLTKVRMDKAKQLMKQSPFMKLKDIAEQSGYADQHYFSRAFKAITGKTPSEYRGGEQNLT